MTRLGQKPWCLYNICARYMPGWSIPKVLPSREIYSCSKKGVNCKLGRQQKITPKQWNNFHYIWLSFTNNLKPKHDQAWYKNMRKTELKRKVINELAPFSLDPWFLPYKEHKRFFKQNMKTWQHTEYMDEISRACQYLTTLMLHAKSTPRTKNCLTGTMFWAANLGWFVHWLVPMSMCVTAI
jgi:hypothetical protein